MAKSEPPKTKKPKTQVTIPWKRRVLAALEANAKHKGPPDPILRPANREQLMDAVDGSKGQINKLLDLDRDPPQLSAEKDKVEHISRLLGIAPPLVETEEDDDDTAAIVHLIRSLTKEKRTLLMGVAKGFNEPKKLDGSGSSSSSNTSPA